MVAETTERAESPNFSSLAFTATPKNVTLNRFGRKAPDSEPREFHLCSMMLVIEEHYILGVFRGESEVEEGAACMGMMPWVRLRALRTASIVSGERSLVDVRLERSIA